MPQIFKGDISKDVLNGTGIIILLFAVSVYLPLVGFFCAVFIPLPTIFYRSKLGRKAGALIPVLAIIVMLMIMGRVSIDLLFFVELLILGFALAEFFEMNLSLEKTVGYAILIVLAAGMLSLLFYSSLTSSGIVALATDYVAKNLAFSLKLYQNMGMSEENIQLISDSLRAIQYILIRIMPALAVMATLFVSWTSILMSRRLMLRKGLFFPDFGILNHWKAPEFLVWGVIGCGLLLLIPEPVLKLFGLNGLLVLMTIFFFEGIAIVAFYFEKKRFPRAIRFFLYSLIALQQIFLLLVIGLGFFDVWLNFRKLETNKNEQAPL